MTEMRSQMMAHVETLSELMNSDKSIVTMTADLVGSCKLNQIEDRFPDRFMNVGIAEQNMLSVAAGLALGGLRPVTHTFSVFSSLRACEQLRSDIFYNNLPVTVIGTHCGVSTGTAGPTHYSLEDMAVVRAMPGSILICPSDDISASWALKSVLADKSPAYIRLDRNPLPRLHSDDSSMVLGQPVPLREGEDVVFFACGSATGRTLKAADALKAKGINSAVYDCITIKPLDSNVIANAARGKRLVVTVEEHSIIGGLGGSVAEILAEQPVNAALVRIGIPDLYPKGGPVEAVRSRLGIDADGIADKVLTTLSDNK